MWSRKHSVCSAVSGASRCDDAETCAITNQLYPFAVALRVRVLQIVCGIAGLVVGAVGWLEERDRPLLGLAVPTGALTVLAAATSVYYSRGFGGWTSTRAGAMAWGPPWRILGPTPCAAIPLTLLWSSASAANILVAVFCMRSLLNIGCGSTTCVGVAGAQLSVSMLTLASAVYMVQVDLRYDPTLSPPQRNSDAHTCTAVSMVPLTSVAIGSGDGTSENPGGGSPQASSDNKPVTPEPPT